MKPPFDPWLTTQVSLDVSMAGRADAAALAARTRQRLSALLASAQRGSPMYRRLLEGRDPRQVSLDELPVVTKRGLMHAFADWVADPDVHLDALTRFAADPSRVATPFLDRYIVWESSGSSGEPGVFLQDSRAMAVYDALEALRRPNWRPMQRWLDPFGLGDSTVFIGALGGHFASTVSLERLRRLNPLCAQRVHSLSFLQPIDKLVGQLQARSPTVVATYPTAAVLLAGEQLAGRLRLSLDEVWTGGETLTPAMRHHIQEAFGCPVANSYGASEFLTLAAECCEQHLHLNSDWAILEPVDAEGRAVEPGMPGVTTLLTNLANHAQPLIRYDLGDCVTVSPHACACGSHLPVIEVDGRCDDTLLLGAAGTQPGIRVLPLALSTVLEEEAGLFDFQLVQQGPSELDLRTASRGAAAQRALLRGRSALADFLGRQGARGVRIHCHSGVGARRGRSGKIQRVLVDDAVAAAGDPAATSKVTTPRRERRSHVRGNKEAALRTAAARPPR
ncbi:MAG: phenylacetate--CoA ligase family protein [Rhizobacter sp.]